jgi:preprotein translocase subunit SecD
MVNTKENPIWEYFEESKTDSKFANCRNCKKKLTKGSELTAKLTTPNLKLHLKTIHPALHSQLVKKEMSKTVMEKKKETCNTWVEKTKEISKTGEEKKEEMSKARVEKKEEMHKTGEEKKKEMSKTVVEKKKEISKTVVEKKKVITNVMKSARGDR